MTEIELPFSVCIDKTEYLICPDFRNILPIIFALNDAELSIQEKSYIMINNLYLEPQKITDIQQALDKASWFISCGEHEKSIGRSLFDWENDFRRIIAPINKNLTYESRTCDFLHWWSFIDAFHEIGDCTFQFIVSIRNKLQKGQKLEKYEQDFYNDHREMVDLQERYSKEEQELFSLFGV